MIRLFRRVTGRLPVGWLQLVHNRTRLTAALAGVAFANVLIFMQLGFMGALGSSTRLPYATMQADILLYAPTTNTLSDAETLPRQRMFQALALPEIIAGTPVYTGKLDWQRPNGQTSSMLVFAADPAANAFLTGDQNLATRMHLQNRVVVDRLTRSAPPELMDRIEKGAPPYQFEFAGQTLTVPGTIRIGAGFDADGYMIMSDQTFLGLFPNRVAGAPNYIFLKLAPDHDINAAVTRLRQVLPATDTRVETLADAAAASQAYQTTQRPIGVVFGFGVVIGLLVGVVIVYQVLSTDVADHLSEYATFKAMGFRQRFFTGIVFEQALVLASLGFVPGIGIALGLYYAASQATGLPVEMTVPRACGVFVATLFMCAASGAVATRRLAAADPADLF